MSAASGGVLMSTKQFSYQLRGHLDHLFVSCSEQAHRQYCIVGSVIGPLEVGGTNRQKTQGCKLGTNVRIPEGLALAVGKEINTCTDGKPRRHSKRKSL